METLSLEYENFDRSHEGASNHIDYSRDMIDNLEIATKMWDLNPDRAEVIANIIYSWRDGDFETMREAVEYVLNVPDRDLMEEGEMLGSENRNFAHYLMVKGYTQDMIDNIAHASFDFGIRDCQNCKFFDTQGEDENDLCTNPTSCAETVTCDYGCKFFTAREV